jgi:hypothetical protein
MYVRAVGKDALNCLFSHINPSGKDCLVIVELAKASRISHIQSVGEGRQGSASVAMKKIYIRRCALGR